MSRKPATFFSSRAVLPPLATLLLLTGCAAAPDWTALDQQAFTIRAACERQHINGTIATALATEQCANTRIRNLYADAHYPQLAVLDAYLARRETIATAVDRQTIPPAEAHVKLAEAQTEQASALQQHGADPVVFDTAPYPVLPLCPHVDRIDLVCN